jgi:opacity protein-like surface antigen
MKSIKALPVLALAATLSVLPLQAQSASRSAGSVYGGVSYALTEQTISGIDGTFEPSALIARLGYFPIDRIALEGRFGVGNSGDSITQIDRSGAFKADLEIDHLFGAYAIAYLPVPLVTPYVMLGVTRAKSTLDVISFPVATESQSRSGTGLSYGLGVDFNPLPLISISVEYTEYLDRSALDISAFSLGVKISF